MNIRAFLAILAVFAVGIGAGAEDAKSIRSIREDRLDVIRYGIDTEIVELLSTLKEEKDTSLAENVRALLSSTTNSRLVKEIFDYFRVVKDGRAEDYAYSLLDRQDETKPDLLVATLNYLAETGKTPQLDKIKPLLKHKNQTVVSAAIRFLGKTKEARNYEALRELFDAEGTSTQIRGEIILAFGELKAKEAVGLLKKVLEDEGEDMSLRRFACDSLGRIGDPEALPSVRKALDANDNLLRAYAVSALGNFPGKETESVLLSALRDSFPRVRELAADRLGDLKTLQATDPLVYRSKKDSEKKVRLASIRALSKIGGDRAVGFLQECLEDEKTTPEFRSFTAEQLVERHLSEALPSLMKVMDQEWKKDNSPLLDSVCKLLSATEASGLETAYKRMLEHRSYIIQIYALRGIKRNKLPGFTDQIKEFTKDKYQPQLRKQALSVLEG